ncbi:hypothetical protein GCM10020366_05940 [Saccharopolyspora gregorii]|uniref:Uncharacterized protein n=1 Tax=Saccharopolyspora gregorii TaxID=33914 RepID=A0ABP6RHB0_9PSEU
MHRRERGGHGRARVDLLVVGAGPAGLFAAYYAGFRGLSVAWWIRCRNRAGRSRRCTREKLIFDVPGFPAVRGRDLVAALVEQPRRANRATCWAGTPPICPKWMDGCGCWRARNRCAREPC